MVLKLDCDALFKTVPQHQVIIQYFQVPSSRHPVVAALLSLFLVLGFLYTFFM